MRDAGFQHCCWETFNDHLAHHFRELALESLMAIELVMCLYDVD